MEKKEIKGVSFHKAAKKFTARVTIASKRKSLGYFETEAEAIKHYKLAKKHISNGTPELITVHHKTFSTPYKGVCFDKKYKRYSAGIYLPGNPKRIYLGYFKDAYSAHLRVQEELAKIVSNTED